MTAYGLVQLILAVSFGVAVALTLRFWHVDQSAARNEHNRGVVRELEQIERERPDHIVR